MLSDSEIRVIENLECPSELQEMINTVGGFNPYGEPNFKVVWAQSETTWQGGHWKVNPELDEGYFTGYREVLLGDGLPHWILLQWVDSGKAVELPFLPPEEPDDWYRNNTDPETGLCILGEYPYEGSYQIVMNMSYKPFINGKLKLIPWELNSDVIDRIIPVIEQAKEVEIKSMIKLMKDEKEKEEQDKMAMFEDIYKDIKINPNLHASWLDDKQRAMDRQKVNAKPLPKGGFFQSDHQL